MGLLSPMVFLCFPIRTWLETFETLTQQADLRQEAGTGRTYPGGGRGAESESIKECVKIKSHNCWYHSADCSRLKSQNFLLLVHNCGISQMELCHSAAGTSGRSRGSCKQWLQWVRPKTAAILYLGETKQ